MASNLSADLNGHKIYVQFMTLHSHLVGSCFVCVHAFVSEVGYAFYFFVVFSAPCVFYCHGA